MSQRYYEDVRFQAPEETTLKLENVPATVGFDELRKMLRKFGAIQSSRVQRSKFGTLYIRYYTVASAERAARELHGVSIHGVPMMTSIKKAHASAEIKFKFVDALEFANSMFGFNGWTSSVISVTLTRMTKQADETFDVEHTAVVGLCFKCAPGLEFVARGSMAKTAKRDDAIAGSKKAAISNAVLRGLSSLVLRVTRSGRCVSLRAEGGAAGSQPPDEPTGPSRAHRELKRRPPRSLANRRDERA
ncbi:hypothetical protein M885DRAFT_531268 [Pelagophyceae sp. CCMP2097]|nr:hypothetical protein M885DRAFT_531268 [Pelagophyceae sp. CCMP2097]|mmetsp:Transcript_20728/g.71200  ORF Transcript_20728/g.71200 Transcript_20728/m.71200 type:complete len:246 (-) Transcript_20728:1123-1860(-)